MIMNIIINDLVAKHDRDMFLKYFIKFTNMISKVKCDIYINKL